MSVLILTSLLVIQILVLRGFLILRQRRSERFLKIWRPILMQSLEEIPTDVPHIMRADAYTFLSVWNYLHESLLDTVKDNLNQLARMTKMDKTARRMLRHRSIRWQLMAIVTLGNLRDERAWVQLQRIVFSRHTVLSLAAARALMQINPIETIWWLLPLIAERQDWPITRVIRFLKEAGADVVSVPLAYTLLSIEPEYQARLVRFLEVAHNDEVQQSIRYLLETSEDEQVLHHCLQFLNDPEDLLTARKHLTHSQWFVRLQAAVAIGRVGMDEDQERLIPLLEDPQWWVRYRAAQSLVNWPAGDLTKLEELAATHHNPFAGEILTQAIAERRMQEEQRR